mmetsp:Transcript_8461/g.15309  ORF Transcript_8461/g.15309 Transcript_8461/m.15309 type:complete len:315 (-) Transcript_8461:83-1027(-)
MNVLLAVDHFALLCNEDSCNHWLVDFVESKKVYVTYHDEDNPDGFECQLLDLPNWSFSFALALFRVYDETKDGSEKDYAKERADEAIQVALYRFPSVIGQLLAKNDVDTTNRSLQMDWPSVLDFVDNLITDFQNTLSDAARSDPVIRSCTFQAYENIVQIFVQQNHKLWSSWAVNKWVHENLQTLKDAKKGEQAHIMVPLSPAVMRFAKCDRSDYEDKFQTMPAEANPLDPNVVAHAMHVDTNRPRFMQRMPRGAGLNGAGGLNEEELAAFVGRGANFAGPPTVDIDPDLPLLEVFWRSALPWAHVEGVPPPNR